MPFTWDFTNVKDWKSLCYEGVGEYDEDGNELGRLKEETNALIWVTRSIGLNCIKEKNIDKFCLRLGMLEEVEGAYLYKKNKDGKTLYSTFEYDDGDKYENALTESIIRKHIGLHTNADTCTDAKFDRVILNKIKCRVRNHLRRSGDDVS